jgi:hypothetical protein
MGVFRFEIRRALELGAVAAVDILSDSGRIPPMIVVGIKNTADTPGYYEMMNGATRESQV